MNASVEVATETPDADLGFFGLMALVGLYVGVIPVAIGMLWLPWIRRIDPRYVQFLMALTLGLLGFLAIDALARGHGLRGPGVAGLRRRGARVPRGGDRVPRARGGGRAPARHRGEGEGRGCGAVAAGVPRGARHRPAQPRRGPGHRLLVRHRLAGAWRRADRGLRAAQHHRGTRHSRAGGQGEGSVAGQPAPVRRAWPAGRAAGGPRRVDRGVGLQPQPRRVHVRPRRRRHRPGDRADRAVDPRLRGPPAAPARRRAAW